MKTLRVTGVTASLGGREILHGIDLEVPAGTTSVILGPSGCGKTTLLRVVAGFQVPDSGTVCVGDAVVVGSADGRSRWVPAEARGIGYVSQEGNLFPHLSVGGNVLYGLPRSQRRGSAATARLAELLDLVGLPGDLAQRRPDQLSGGQQQRVALARALAPRPELVLLDEPFSSLDAGLRASTREAVAEALAREQVTVVLVTHDQNEALSFADKVAIMREGRFTQVGTPQEVYESPTDLPSATFLGDAVVLPGRAADGVVLCALGVLPYDGLVTGPRGRADSTPYPTVQAAHGDGVSTGARASTGSPGAHGATDAVEVLVRPEQIRLVDPATDPVAPRARVLSTTYYGHDALVLLATSDGTTVKARVVGRQVPAVGAEVALQTVGVLHVFPAIVAVC